MHANPAAVIGVAAALLAGCASYRTDVSNNAEDACIHARDADAIFKYCNAAIEGGRVPDYRAAAVYNNRGLAYLVKKQYDPALADFEQAVSLEPYQPVLYANRGDARLGKQEFDRAIADYDLAVEKSDGGWPEVFVHRGLALLWKHEDARALDSFDRAVRMSGNGSAGPLIFRAVGRMALRDYAGASADLRKALDLEPGAAAAEDGLCRTLAFEGRTYEAVAHCERALKAQKKPEGALFARGYVYLRNGDWKAALSDCAEAARLSPVPAMPLFCSAYAHERLGELEQAKSGYAAARAADPKVDEAMQRLGIKPGSTEIKPEA